MSDIVLSNLSKAYDDKQVLDHLSLTLPEGKRTFIMGPSGCGKTTLLNILCGLQKADEGEIRNLPKKIGVVFQENRLCEHFTALENVRMVAPDKTETAKDILSRLGLANDLYQKAASLSGGMKRRVAIARALCYDAPFVVMDEPFKGLDEDTKETVMETVMDMTKGKTLLIITHDEQEAQRFADNIVVLQEH